MIYSSGQLGGVAEWLKAAVLKTVECQSSVGSNPTSSARFKRRNGRVAEGARLLSEYRGKTLSRVRISLSPPISSVSRPDTVKSVGPFFV